MSLKAFHLLFITLSVILCLGFGAWCLGSDYAEGRPGYVAVGWVAFLVAIALVGYEIMFVRKLRNAGRNP
jgi:hypothetical protein